jgi:hypothetical protein
MLQECGNAEWRARLGDDGRQHAVAVRQIIQIFPKIFLDLFKPTSESRRADADLERQVFFVIKPLSYLSHYRQYLFSPFGACSSSLPRLRIFLLRNVAD